MPAFNVMYSSHDGNVKLRTHISFTPHFTVWSSSHFKYIFNTNTALNFDTNRLIFRSFSLLSKEFLSTLVYCIKNFCSSDESDLVGDESALPGSRLNISIKILKKKIADFIKKKIHFLSLLSKSLKIKTKIFNNFFSIISSFTLLVAQFFPFPGKSPLPSDNTVTH